MTPIYNGQESHFKRMLDLQERLRRSEEERIRLEERFNLLVQESRTRHQACIHRLRIRYVEFLEEQRLRDERNNKLLGSLEKVDNSLTLITAKTERLNVLRKQYEGYLLRVYGAQQRAGSVTADSGLDSHLDPDLPPSPVLPKFVKVVPIRNAATSPLNDEDTLSVSPINRRTSTAENKNIPKFSYSVNKSPPEVRQNLHEKYFSQMPNITKPPDSWETVRTRSLYSTFSLLDENPLKYSSRVDSLLDEMALNRKVTEPVPDRKPNLDYYLEKIRRLQGRTSPRKNLESEPSGGEEPEQNTSGDLLNVTLSEDGGVEYSEGEVLEPKRQIKKRDTYSKFNVAPVTQKPPEITVHEVQPEISEFPSLLTRPGSGQQKQQPIEDALAKLASIQEIIVPAVTIMAKPAVVTPSPEPSEELSPEPKMSFPGGFPGSKEIPEFKATNVDLEDLKVSEKEEEEEEDVEEGNDDDDEEPDDDDEEPDDDDDDNDGIEDDYDDSVDIDSWMPDNSDLGQEKEPLPLHLDLRNRPRRKLEAIEEVEQPEDEDSIDLLKNRKETSPKTSHESYYSGTQNGTHQYPKAQTSMSSQDYYGYQGTQDYPAPSTSKSENPKAENEPEIAAPDAYSKANEDYNQQYYQQQENGSASAYDQQQDPNQPYQYDPNQPYQEYDPNAQYAGYEGQQYTEADYANYEQYQQQYDPSQYDPSQYDPSQYENYQQDPGTEAAYETGAYDYGEQPETSKAEEPVKDYEKTPVSDFYPEESDVESHKSSSKSKDPVPKERKKKDAVRAILDSDSESFIERNLSNTESDYDFN